MALGDRGAAPVNAQHSASSMEHGSPPVSTDLARAVFGGRIGLDPFSSAYWNRHTTKADRYIDRERDGLVTSWRLEGEPPPTVFENPPGADKAAGTKSLVRKAWERTVQMLLCGAIDGAYWHGYSLEQFVHLQGAPMHPLQFVTLVFCERLDHLVRPPGGGPPQKQGSPTHGSYATLLPTRRAEADARAQVQRFRDLGVSLGAIVRPF